MNTPKISIVTPTYNMLHYLKHCISSVADQDVAHEHIIVDGRSSDGTPEWLQANEGLRWVSEKDRGMYDALNKGLGMARGEIVAHLNSDEQYLPGTLRFIADYFDRHPEVDFVVGDFLLIDNEGDLKAYRKTFTPYWPFFFSNYLYTFTCTLFYRKRVIEKIQYNTEFKSIADVDFFYKMIKEGFKGAHIRQFLAVFTLTGKNLSADPISEKEKEIYRSKYLPGWFPLAKPFFRAGFYIARIWHGTLKHRGSLSYAIYTNKSPHERISKQVSNITWKWN
ncbi:MAG TPA: glycosyltransferase family 2 protein [Flavisolibacter sp.]|nr:glycosyltransferase family 2 protein [Flavisolibacter sp.]